MSFIWQGKEQTHDTSPNSDLCPNFFFSQWSHLFYDAGLTLISHYLKIKMNTTLVYSSSIRMINFKNVNEVLSWTAGRGQPLLRDNDIDGEVGSFWRRNWKGDVI